MDKVQVLARSRSDFAGGVDELTFRGTGTLEKTDYGYRLRYTAQNELDGSAVASEMRLGAGPGRGGGRSGGTGRIWRAAWGRPTRCSMSRRRTASTPATPPTTVRCASAPKIYIIELSIQK